MACLCAAGIHTGSPPKRVHMETNVMSDCTPDERNRLNPALSAGYSNGWFRDDAADLPVDLRTGGVGEKRRGEEKTFCVMIISPP